MAQLVIATGKLGLDKNDKIAQELLDAGNWRQALANVERRLKRNPSDDRLLLNRSLILVSSDDAEKHEQGVNMALKLLQREAPFANPEFLKAIDRSELGRSHSVANSLVNMWEKMQKAYPESEQIQDAAFEGVFNRDLFSSARAVAAKARLASVNKRIHFFREVACGHLASKAKIYSNKQLQVFGKLASESARKSAAQTKANQEFCERFAALSISEKRMLQVQAKQPIDKTSLAVQTIFDLQFVIYLLVAQGNDEQALALLNDDTRTGIRSSIGAASWEFVCEKIDILQRLQKWEELKQFCSELLSDAALEASGTDNIPKYSHGSAGDDWAVWIGLLKACCQLGRENELMASGLLENENLKKRHRLLAGVRLQTYCQRLGNTSEQLITALAMYQNEYRLSPACFRDLRYFTTRLTAFEKKEMVSIADRCSREEQAITRVSEGVESSATDCVKSEINALKLDYHLIVSASTHLVNTRQLESFIASCLRLYEISLQLEGDLPPTERRCGDDAAILAAIACIHLYHEGKPMAQLQATLILERLLKHSKHNYEAILLAIRLYVCQGAFSKAFDLYTRLDIKNIQILTEAWILLTRISTLYPHGTEKARDVHALLQGYNGYMQEKIAARAKISWAYINQENFKGLCEAYDFLTMCEDSISGFLLGAEFSRIDWRKSLCHGQKYVEDPLYNEEDWTDIREVAAFPNYEHQGQPHIEQYMRAGPVPSVIWIDLQSCLMNLRNYFHAKFVNKNVENVLDEADGTNGIEADDYASLSKNEFQSSSGLTPCEAWSARPIYAISSALLAVLAAHQKALEGDLEQSDRSESSSGAQNWDLNFLRRDKAIADWDVSLLQRAEILLSSAIREMSSVLEAHRFFENFADDPIKVFGARQWEVLHVYYMTSELCALYIGVLGVAVAFSRKLNEAAETFPQLSRLQYMINTNRWSDALDGVKARGAAILREYQQGVRILRAHWRDGGNIDGVVDVILEKGNSSLSTEDFKESLRLVLPRDFVVEKSRELADSWIDGLDGVLKEQDITSWFMGEDG